jgi:hypothetical protein
LVCAINALASEEACIIEVAHGGFLQALIFVGVIAISFRKLPFRMALLGEESIVWLHESQPPSKMKTLFIFFVPFCLMKAPLIEEKLNGRAQCRLQNQQENSPCRPNMSKTKSLLRELPIITAFNCF